MYIFFRVEQVHLSHARPKMPRSLSILHVVNYLNGPVTSQLHLLVVSPPINRLLHYQLAQVVGVSQLYQMQTRMNLLHHQLQFLRLHRKGSKVTLISVQIMVLKTVKLLKHGSIS